MSSQSPDCPIRRLPKLIVAADWSKDEAKRWIVVATRDREGSYLITAAEPSGHGPTLVRRLQTRMHASEGALIGFDYPIGVSRAYAEQAQIMSFPAALMGTFGFAPGWEFFYEPATAVEEISIQRPFFPRNPNQQGYGRQDLADGLGVPHFENLRRVCEQQTGGRPAACPVFWTVGGSPAKAAIHGWSSTILPALRDEPEVVRIWPFDGELMELLSKPSVVLAEIYPTDARVQLRIDINARGTQETRQAVAEQLLGGLEALPVRFDDAARVQIVDGFGTAAAGEDQFDAMCGLIAMLHVVLGEGYRGTGGEHLQQEGWILGQNR